MSLDIASPLPCKEPFLHLCGWRGLLTSGMRDMWSRQGPAFFFNCLAIIFLESPSIENESPTALPWGNPSVSCLTSTNCKRNLVCSGVLEAAYTGSPEQFLCISSPRQHHPLSLKSAMLEIGTPWKLANATSGCCFLRELLIYSVLNLDLFVCGILFSLLHS